jgi:hypothetical protein
MHLNPRLSITLLIAPFTCSCSKIDNALDADNDGDGFTAFEGDCDDGDPDTYPGAAFLESETDCMTDADSDGTPTAADGRDAR